MKCIIGHCVILVINFHAFHVLELPLCMKFFVLNIQTGSRKVSTQSIAVKELSNLILQILQYKFTKMFQFFFNVI